MPLDFWISAFTTLFVTIDPPGLAPLFLALTSAMDSKARRQVALRGTLIAGGVLIFFALAGQPFLKLLGISIPAFRIAGGLLLFWIAFEMVFDRRASRKGDEAKRAITRDEIRNMAAFPVAMPLIAGPGAISASILAAAEAPDTVALAGFLGILVLVLAMTLGMLLLADRVSHRLGETGRIIIERLLGLILAALAVQFVADGVKAIAVTG
jgi:multiple antibiotic resistance protein